MSRLLSALRMQCLRALVTALLTAFACVLSGLPSRAQTGSPASSPAAPATATSGITTPAATTEATKSPDTSEVPWWHLVLAHIDEPGSPPDAKENYFSMHPIDLLIPAGWKLQGTVDWPMHRGKPSLTFRVDSPDGRTGLEYLPQEFFFWSEDPATRAEMEASGAKVQPLPPFRATDYLQSTILPRLRPGAQVLAIEPVPAVARYLNDELVGQNTADEIQAQQNGLPVPKSSADAARARIAYVRDGVPVEEWVEIAVEHLQRHAGTGYGAGSGTGIAAGKTIKMIKMIDTFALLECDILRAPRGDLDQESRILGNILAQLQQNDRWTQQISYEHWHGEFNDRVYYFLPSYFGNNAFFFDDPVRDRETYGFAYSNAWRNDGGDQFVVTDSADFDPNGKVGPDRWTRLKQRAR